jgi:hypothetical protein
MGWLFFGLVLVCFGCFVTVRTDQYHAFSLRMIGRSWGRKYAEDYFSTPMSRVRTKVSGAGTALIGMFLVAVGGRALGWW